MTQVTDTAESRLILYTYPRHRISSSLGPDLAVFKHSHTEAWHTRRMMYVGPASALDRLVLLCQEQ